MRGRRWLGSVLVFLIGLAVAGAALARDRDDREDARGARPAPHTIADAPKTLKAPARARSTAAQRARSRTAYAGVPARRALAIARRHIAAGDAGAISLRAPIKRLLGGGGRAALVGSGRVASLVESSVPLVAGEGGDQVDLGLVDAGAARRPANPLVDVRLPDSSSDLAMLGDLAVGARVRGARAVEAAEARGRLFYVNALRDTDLALAPRVRGFELSALLRSARSPERLVVDLALPAGTTVRSARRGGFTLLRGRQAVGAISAPVAWDADGTPVRVAAALRGRSLAIAVAHRDRDLRYPVTVDPEFASFDWTITPGSDVAGWTYSEYQDFTETATSTGLGIAAKSSYLVCNDPVATSSRTVKSALVPPGCVTMYVEYDLNANGTWNYTAPANTSIYRADFLSARHTYQSSCMREGLYSVATGSWQTGTWTALTPGVGGTSGSSPFTYCGGVAAESKQHCLVSSCQPDPARPEQNRVGFQLSLPNGAFKNYSSVHLGGARVFVHDFNNPAVSALGHASDPAVWSGPPYRVMNPTVTDAGLGVKKLTVSWPASGAAGSASSTLPCAGTRTDRCPSSHTQGVHWGDTLLEGQGTATLTVQDLVGNTATSSFTVRHDRSGPGVTLGGALYAARVGSATEQPIGAGTYALTVQATDGAAAPATPADRRAGVAKAQVFTKDLAGNWSLLREWTNACGGDNCALAQQTYLHDAATQPEGVRSFRVVATDRAGNITTQDFDVKSDRTPPAVGLSGALPATTGTLQAGDHDILASATDTSGTGVKDVEVTVDGIRVDYAAQGCPAGGCSLTRGYTFPTDGFTPGQHTLEVTARDHSGKSTKKPVVVNVPSSNSPPALGVGIEDFFNFRGFETGAGSQALVNTANGNLVWHLRALTNRGRGLDTDVDITYNALSSKEDLGHGYDEIGDGFSLAISTLTRLNEALDLRDVGDGVITLTDADGTMHRFTKDAAGDWFNPPPGVNLRLRKFNPSPVTQDQFMKVWAVTRSDGTTYFFDKCGYQRSVQDRNGNALVYEYEAVPPSEPYCFENTWAHRAKLRRVVDAAGADGTAPKADRSVTLAYTNEQTTGDPAAQIASITDHAGRRTTFAYTNTGQLRTITQAAGTTEQRTFAFGYEGEKATDNPCGTVRDPGSGRQDRDVVAIKDPRGNCTELDYLDDATLGGAPKYGLGERVNWLEDRRNNKSSFAYPSTVAPYKVDITDARGKLWKHESDAAFRMTRRIDPLGTVTDYAYDGDNNLAQVKEAAGTPDEAITRMTWNANGELRTHTDAENHTTDLVYRDHPGVYLAATGADAGKGFVSDLLSVTKPRGVATATLGDFTTNYAVDPNGDVRSRTDEEGFRVQWDYTPAGLVKEERAETERGVFSKTTYANFDPNGLPQLVTDARGNATATLADGEWKLRYDRLGNVLDITDPRRAAAPTATIRETFTTEYDYDKLDREVLERVPKRSAAGEFIERRFEYDLNDNVKATVDGNGARSTASYNAMDDPESVKTPAVPHEAEASPAEEETQLRYDEENNLSATVAPNGSATATVDDHTTAYTYDAAGRPVVETRKSRGAVVKDLITSYAYDRRGNVAGLMDPRGNVSGDPVANAASTLTRRWSFSYDKADRQLLAIEDPGGKALHTRTRYDEDGNRVAVVDPRGAAPSITDPAIVDKFTSEFRYDQRGVLTDAIDPKDRRTHFDVRGDGLMKSETSPRGTASAVAGDYTTTYTYDAMGALTGRSVPWAEGQYVPKTWNFTYGRDEVGNPRTITDPRNHTATNTFLDTGDLRTTDRPSFWIADGDAVRMRTPDDPPANEELTDRELGGDMSKGDFGSVKQERMPGLLPSAGLTTLAYDNELRLTGVTDQDGHATTLTRDALGRVQQRRTPLLGSGARFVDELQRYDRNGNLRSQTDGANQKSTLGYDQFDRLVSELTPGANLGPETTSRVYDENDNLTRIVTPRNTLWELGYDRVDRRVSVKDPANGTTTYDYDPTGNKTLERSPLSQGKPDGTWQRHAQFWTYDEAGQLAKQEAGRGFAEPRETTFTYDADGNQVEIRAPGARKGPNDPLAPRVTTRVFDARGLLWTQTTGSGAHERTTAIEHDGNNNPRRQVNAAGVKRGADKTPRNADPGTLPTATSTWNEHATVYQYDADNLIKATFLPWGRKNAEDQERYQTEVERDVLGRITKVYSPYKVSATPSKGRPTTYTHFDTGWIRTSTDNVASPPTFSYDYDGRGLQVEWTGTPNGSTPRRRSERTYWPNGLLKRRVARDLRNDLESRTYDYEYNANRALTRMTDVNRNRVTVYAYDPLERQTLANETWATDAQDTCQSYDANGNVKTRITDATWNGTACQNGKTSTFTFDEQDREIKAVIQQSGAPTRTTDTHWFPSDDIARRDRTRSDNTAKVLDRRYFADDGRLTRLTRTREHDGAQLKDRPYSYDDATNDSADPAQWGNGNRTTDEKGGYRFNSRGQMIQWTPSFPAGSPTQNYSVDGQGQVRSVSGAGLLTTTYQYDGDQLQSKTTGGTTTRYEYFALGELSKIDYDPAESKPDVTYGYDAFSRMNRVDKGADRSTTYKYDALDRRETRVTTTTAKTSTLDFSYVGSTERLSRESKRSDGEADKRRTYDYDSMLERLGQSTQNGTESIAYRSYAFDANGDVEALEESDGRTAARYGYDPYGIERDTDMSDVSDPDLELGEAVAQENPFRYQGAYFDEESETYDMKARDYRPDLARFLSPDRFEAAAQDLRLQLDPSTNSRYAFLGGNPVDQLEFDGHEPPSSFTDCYPGSIYCTPDNPTKKQRARGKAIKKEVADSISYAKQRIAEKQQVREVQTAQAQLREARTDIAMGHLDLACRRAHGIPDSDKTLTPCEAYLDPNPQQTLQAGIGMVITAGSDLLMALSDASSGDPRTRPAGAAGKAGSRVLRALARLFPSRTKYIIGPHREVKGKVGKDEQSHHILQDAAVKRLPGYKHGDAPAIGLGGNMSRSTAHGKATQEQIDSLLGGTLGHEVQVGIDALKKAGVPQKKIDEALAQADDYFVKQLGLTMDTATQVPKNRRNVPVPGG